MEQEKKVEEKIQYSPAGKVKRIDFSLGYFEANGRMYFIVPPVNFSIPRFKEYSKQTLQGAFGTDLNSQVEAWRKVKNALSGQDGYGMNLLKAQHDSLNIAINQEAALLNFIDIKNQHPVLMLCTLICNTKDEDERKWSIAAANQKINDWEEEGLAMEDFFTLSISLIPILKEKFQESWPKSLMEEKSQSN